MMNEHHEKVPSRSEHWGYKVAGKPTPSQTIHDGVKCAAVNN